MTQATPTIGRPVTGTPEQIRDTIAAKGGLKFLARIGDSPMKVRFLVNPGEGEPNSWMAYDEYFSEEVNHYVPKAHGERLPSDTRVMHRYLTSAVNVDENEVVALVLPATVFKDINAAQERRRTVIDCDWILSKSGSGLTTKYAAVRDDPMDRDLDRFTALDIPAVLAEQRADLDAVLSADDAPPAKTAKTLKKA